MFGAVGSCVLKCTIILLCLHFCRQYIQFPKQDVASLLIVLSMYLKGFNGKKKFMHFFYFQLRLVNMSLNVIAVFFVQKECPCHFFLHSAYYIILCLRTYRSFYRIVNAGSELEL